MEQIKQWDGKAEGEPFWSSVYLKPKKKKNNKLTIVWKSGINLNLYANAYPKINASRQKKIENETIK